MKSEQWAHWAEVVGNIAIVATLIILVWEVRTNTSVIERQMVLDRANAVTAPFFEDSGLAEAMVKVKEVDGTLPVNEGFQEGYGLSPEQAVKLQRHLSLIWWGLYADFQTYGVTPELRNSVLALLRNPDNVIWWENRTLTFSEEFIELVEDYRDELSGTATGSE